MFPPQNGAPRARVPAVLKAFKLLEIISLADRPLGVSELARRLNMGKSTVHGLVTTLETLGVLESINGSKRYGLGPRLAALCSRDGNQADLRRIARAALNRLADGTGQTAFLGVVSSDAVTIIDIVHGRPGLSISAPVGTSIPLLAGAVGKVVVASWDSERRHNFLQNGALPAFTSNTISDPNAFERIVDEALASGVAFDRDEYVDGVRAAAAPVRGAHKQLAAVLWVAGFSRHIDDAALASIGVALVREANEIGQRLGDTLEVEIKEPSPT